MTATAGANMKDENCFAEARIARRPAPGHTALSAPPTAGWWANRQTGRL